MSTISRTLSDDLRHQALEATMRDSLDGLAELACAEAWSYVPGCMEILGVESPAPTVTTPRPAPAARAVVLPFRPLRRTA